MPSLPAASRGRLLLVLASAFLARAAAAECRISMEKASLQKVTVQVPGQRFTLDLQAVPVTVAVKHASKGTAIIQVLAPLRFTASYPSKSLVYRIGREVDLYGGRIHLGKRAGYTWLGVRGDGLQVSLRSSLGLQVQEPVIVPCNNIELASSTYYNSPAVSLPPPARTVGTGSAFFPLYLAPEEAAPLSIRYAGPFQVLQRRPGWVLLQANWEDGSQVRGWTRQRFATAKAKSLPGWAGGESFNVPCAVVDGYGFPLAKIKLRKDAPIAASPGGAVWARVSGTISADAFPLDRRDGWIQIAAVPGLPARSCSDHDHIWVHSRDVLGPVPREHTRK